MNSSLEIRSLSFTKTTLPNGLDVIVRRQGDMPIVAMNLWYHVGSKNEAGTQRGFAHLFEHLMFEGSAHFPGDFFKPLQRLGATINGSTSSDRTNYFVDLPAAHLALGLAMESDRMGHFLPALSDEKIRIQKDVVKNEYRQNYANRGYGHAWRIIAEAMYPPDHPYSWLTIGAMEDVEAASRGDVESFFQRYYVPSNASLAPRRRYRRRARHRTGLSALFWRSPRRYRGDPPLDSGLLHEPRPKPPSCVILTSRRTRSALPGMAFGHSLRRRRRCAFPRSQTSSRAASRAGSISGCWVVQGRDLPRTSRRIRAAASLAGRSPE